MPHNLLALKKHTHILLYILLTTSAHLWWLNFLRVGRVSLTLVALFSPLKLQVIVAQRSSPSEWFFPLPPLPRYLVMPGDISGCHTGGKLLASRGQRPRMLINTLTNKTDPYNKELASPKCHQCWEKPLLEKPILAMDKQ